MNPSKAIFLLLGLCCLPWHLLYAQIDEDAIEVIQQVSFVIDDSLQPPGDERNWEPLQLPLGSRSGDAENSNRVIWMRFQLDAPETPEDLALYFYRYNLSIDVYFNGLKIGGDSYREGFQTVSWNHPRLVPIQAANWLPSSNVVHVRFTTSYYGGTFGEILFGPAAGLNALMEQTTFRQITVNQWVQYAGIIALFLSFSLWVLRRKDITYLLFTGMTACWIVLASHMVIYYNFIDYRYWLPLVHLSTDVWGLLFFHFVSRLTRIDRPRVSKALSVWAVAAICWNLFAPLSSWWMGAYVMHAIGNLFILYLLGCVVRKALLEKDRLSLAICLTICVQLLFFLHDFLQILFATSEDWRSAMYLSQLAFPLLMLVFVGALVQRFLSALAEAEKLNRELEVRVEAGKKLVERSLAEKHELELKQAATKQRIDIYRDLHDDVGSKLLSIVHADLSADKDKKMGDLARSALQSLRNSVSRANSPEQPLNNFVADVYEEAKLRLQGSGHRLQWQQRADLPETILDSTQVFNLGQVFRELISNIIRHAQATCVDIETRYTAESLKFSVIDNGVGLGGTNCEGNGLGNVLARIEELGGSVHWQESESGGVKVEFSIPVGRV